MADLDLFGESEIDIEISVPVYSVAYTGQRLLAQSHTFLSAFLASIVELGGAPSEREIANHLLPAVPLQITKSIIRKLENYGLVTPLHQGFTLTTAGLEALSTGQVPQEENGTWVVDYFVPSEGNVQILRFEAIKVTDFELKTASRDRRTGSENSNTVPISAANPALFDQWHSDIGQSAKAFAPIKPAKHAAVLIQQRAVFRWKKRPKKSPVVSYQYLSKDFAGVGPNAKFRSWIDTKAKQIVDLSQKDLSFSIDDLSDSQVLTRTIDWSLNNFEVEHTIKCQSAQVRNVSIIPQSTEYKKWFARCVYLQIPFGCSKTAMDDVLVSYAKEFGIDLPSTSQERLSMIRETLKLDHLNKSDQWWNLHMTNDWDLT